MLGYETFGLPEPLGAPGYETFGRLEPPGRWVRDLWPSGAAGGARVRDFWPPGDTRKPKTALGYETFGRQQPPGRHQRPPGAQKSRTLGSKIDENGTRVRTSLTPPPAKESPYGLGPEARSHKENPVPTHFTGNLDRATHERTRKRYYLILPVLSSLLISV